MGLYHYVNEAYADDFSLTESVPDLDSLGPKLTEHLALISEWAEDNNLNLAPEKSHVTLFTPWNREVNFHPQVFMNGVFYST
jgi:hypothetical protein